jgi:predicted small secreted protein
VLSALQARLVRLLVPVLVVVAAGVVATASSAKQSTKRSGALHVTKECSQYNGSVGSFCTITSSNINAIEPGMRVVYLAAPSGGVLDADIVLSFEHGSAAYGHVLLNLATKQGHITFAGGTGRFTWFHADAAVSLDSAGVWHWDGTYSFTPPGND